MHSVVKAVGFTVGSFVADLAGLTVGSSETSQLLHAALQYIFWWSNASINISLFRTDSYSLDFILAH